MKTPCTIEALRQLKERLEARAPYIISEVVLPNWIHPELRKIKTQDFQINIVKL